RPRVAAARRICVEVAEPVRLDRLQGVGRTPGYAVPAREPVLRDLLRVHVPDEQATAARGRWTRGRVPDLAVVANHGAVRQHALAVLQQEVLPARVRSGDR